MWPCPHCCSWKALFVLGSVDSIVHSLLLFVDWFVCVHPSAPGRAISYLGALGAGAQPCCLTGFCHIRWSAWIQTCLRPCRGSQMRPYDHRTPIIEQGLLLITRALPMTLYCLPEHSKDRLKPDPCSGTCSGPARPWGKGKERASISC